MKAIYQAGKPEAPVLVLLHGTAAMNSPYWKGSVAKFSNKYTIR